MSAHSLQKCFPLDALGGRGVNVGALKLAT
jgi:hypothetical protein